MARSRYPEVPRVCAQCGVHWTQCDGQPPRAYCTTTCRQEAEGRPFPIVPVAAQVPVLPTRIRRVQAQLVTLTCAWCQTVVEVEHFPGPLPRFCSQDCRDEAQRAGAAARMRRLRQRRLLAFLAAAAPRSRS
jgi:hypothetical protein